MSGANPLCANTRTITGHISINHAVVTPNGRGFAEPLPFANLMVQSLQEGEIYDQQTTDELGNFELAAPETGEAIVRYLAIDEFHQMSAIDCENNCTNASAHQFDSDPIAESESEAPYVELISMPHVWNVLYDLQPMQEYLFERFAFERPLKIFSTRDSSACNQNCMVYDAITPIQLAIGPQWQDLADTFEVQALWAYAFLAQQGVVEDIPSFSFNQEFALIRPERAWAQGVSLYFAHLFRDSPEVAMYRQGTGERIVSNLNEPIRNPDGLTTLTPLTNHQVAYTLWQLGEIIEHESVVQFLIDNFPSERDRNGDGADMVDFLDMLLCQHPTLRQPVELIFRDHPFPYDYLSCGF